MLQLNSDDSVVTIGRITNASGVTGRAPPQSPINQRRLDQHAQFYASYNGNDRNKGLRRFSYGYYPTANKFNNPTGTATASIPPIQTNEQYVWRHPGGVVSLLAILGQVLHQIEDQLLALSKIATLTDFVQNVGIYLFMINYLNCI